jgi:hypothetical protein
MEDRTERCDDMYTDLPTHHLNSDSLDPMLRSTRPSCSNLDLASRIASSPDAGKGRSHEPAQCYFEVQRSAHSELVLQECHVLRETFRKDIVVVDHDLVGKQEDTHRAS